MPTYTKASYGTVGGVVASVRTFTPSTLATAPSAFRLLIAFTTNPLDTPVWTDVSAYLVRASIRRGRNRELDRFEAGTATFRLFNQDRRFDPTYSSSAYYPNVIPGKRVRFIVTLNGVGYVVFDGYVDGWPQDWTRPAINEVDVPCTDGFKILANAELSSSLSAASSGVQAAAVLDQVGWPAIERDLDTGQSTIVAKTVAAGDGVLALNRLQEIADAEGGQLYMSRAGRVVLESRHRRLTATRSTTVQATFGDSAAELEYDELVPSYDDELIRNDVSVTPSAGNTQTATDTTSQQQFGKRSFAQSIEISSEPEAAAKAQFLVSKYKDPALRFDQMTVLPVASRTVWEQALGLDISDLVTVKRRPPGGGTITQNVFVEGVEHDVEPGPGGSWRTRFRLSPATAESYWVLESSTNGVLDTTTRLAY